MYGALFVGWRKGFVPGSPAPGRRLPAALPLWPRPSTGRARASEGLPGRAQHSDGEGEGQGRRVPWRALGGPDRAVPRPGRSVSVNSSRPPSWPGAAGPLLPRRAARPAWNTRCSGRAVRPDPGAQLRAADSCQQATMPSAIGCGPAAGGRCACLWITSRCVMRAPGATLPKFSSPRNPHEYWLSGGPVDSVRAAIAHNERYVNNAEFYIEKICISQSPRLRRRAPSGTLPGSVLTG